MNYQKIKLYFWRIIQFLKFFFLSKSKWKIHSPFVYELTTKVFPKIPTSFGFPIEKIRKNYLHSNEIIEIQDFGAGFGNHKKFIIQKKLSEITKSSARKRKEGELLYRIILHHKPRCFLELGTNLGFSSIYFAHGLKEIYGNDYQMTSIEGAKNLYLKAKKLLNSFDLKINLVNDTFDNYLENHPNELYDAVFIDGNHQYESTIKYFNFLKNQMKKGGLMIFDDIYWNPAMLKAWNYIIKDPDVTVSIDLFEFGLVYINKNQEKEHFRVWY